LNLKKRISDHLKDIDAEIESLKSNAEEEADFTVKEELYKELDEITKERINHWKKSSNHTSGSLCSCKRSLSPFHAK
jgi:hypothetical protein